MTEIGVTELGMNVARRGTLPGALRLAGVGLMLCFTPAAGQERPPADSVAGPGAFRLLYGATFARPFLDDASSVPFEQIGDFRAGPGIQVGAGVRVRAFELTGTVDLAGVDVGVPLERDGIPMGRRSSVLRAFALTLWWDPPGLERSGWRGRVGAGYIAGSLDNASVAPDQLPEDLRAFAATVQSVGATLPVGVGGRGVRLGVGAEHDIGRSLAVRGQIEADFIGYRSFIVRQDRFQWDGGGSGWTPRLAALVRWAP